MHMELYKINTNIYIYQHEELPRDKMDIDGHASAYWFWYHLIKREIITIQNKFTEVQDYTQSSIRYIQCIQVLEGHFETFQLEELLSPLKNV